MKKFQNVKAYKICRIYCLNRLKDFEKIISFDNINNKLIGTPLQLGNGEPKIFN